MTTVADPEYGGAYQLVADFLSRYGLESLTSWAYDRFLETGDPSVVIFELYDRPEFHERFPAYEVLAKDGEAIDIDAYMEYEQRVGSLLQRYGVPEGMFDMRKDIADMLIKRVDVAEVKDRLDLAVNAVNSVPQVVRDEMLAMGMSPGDMVGFWLDPDRAVPVLEKQFAQASVAGAANEAGFRLTMDRVTELAERGYSYTDTRQALQAAARLRSLTGGFGETATEGNLVGAVTDTSADVTQVERVQQSRRSQFEGGGGASAAAPGVTGLGRAATR